MQARLQQFLQAENISPSQFADHLGVQRSGVSHILAGRNKPGFEFIEKMLHRYPALNAEWLITGKGKMYKSDVSVPAPSGAPTPFSPSLFDIPRAKTLQPAPSAQPQEEKTLPVEKTIPSTTAPPIMLPKSSVSVSKIILLYSDNTFVEFTPQ